MPPSVYLPGSSVGRYKIIRALGQGGQGEVWLAEDVQSERQVAIKTWRGKSRQKIDGLLRSARAAGKLLHPGIVPLHEAGEQHGNPYLVYAHVDGSSLAAMLKDGPLPPVKSAEIACALLEALEYAHGQGVMHANIKSANIMLAQRGQPMLMDFGISLMDDEAAAADRDAAADVYAAGQVLCEMVTGSAALGANVAADASLAAILSKALARDDQERYRDAATMRAALNEYLGSLGDIVKAGDAHSTMDFLLRRMRSKGDFPALSNIITDINNIASSESESSNKLARVILQDYALTNKLLRLVNTVSFGQFGGKINTISKAVVILGFETVRNIAMTLILLEFMQNQSQAKQMKDEIIAAFFAGMVAAQLSGGKDIRDVEEIMICSMFHNLGRMLAMFYFYDESQEISGLMEQGLSEEHAAIKVLGLTYSALGVGVAKTWKLPQRLLAGMEKLPSGGKVAKRHGEMEQMVVTVNLANELCSVAALTSLQEKGAALLKLRQRYQGAADYSERKMNEAIDAGLNELASRAMTLEISTARSAMIQQVRKWSGHVVPDKKAEQVIDITDTDGLLGMNGVSGIEAALTGEEANRAARADPETVLGAGIQDVTNTLVEDYNLNDLLLMVLETIYRGLGFKRALILIRDNKHNAMSARIGLGADIETIIPAFHFELAFKADVFHLAIEKGVDIVIEDVQAQNIAAKIPAWYRQLVDAQSFVLLPVVVNKKTLGLFYADMQHANSLQVSERQLSLLRTLRNQAVLAIKQKL